MSKLNYEKFKNMKPMKYYEGGGLNDFKAKEMIENKDNNYFAMAKYDGEWARAIIMEDGVLIQSRSISKITGTYGDKTEHVPHIVEELKTFPPGTVLLGELAFKDMRKTSRDVGSILRCLPPKAVSRQEKEKLHYFVFDVLAWCGEDMSDQVFKGRFLGYPIKGKYIDFAMNTNSNFMEFAEYVWEQGGEGIVIIKKDSLYRPGSRKAWDTLKVKKKLGEIEMQVISRIDPKKHYDGTELDNWKYFEIEKKNGKLGWIHHEFCEGYKAIRSPEFRTIPVTKPYFYSWKNGVVVQYQGRKIKVTSGMTDQDREWLATDAAEQAIYAGELYAVITGMEMTEDSIRHPVLVRLRNDM